VGLSVQTFDVYVDIDPGSGTGARRMIDCRNAALASGNGWERALTVDGWGSALITATSESDMDETQPTMKIRVIRTVSFPTTTPRSTCLWCHSPGEVNVARFNRLESESCNTGS
jgi:hypothetical protein